MGDLEAADSTWICSEQGRSCGQLEETRSAKCKLGRARDSYVLSLECPGKQHYADSTQLRQDSSADLSSTQPNRVPSNGGRSRGKFEQNGSAVCELHASSQQLTCLGRHVRDFRTLPQGCSVTAAMVTTSLNKLGVVYEIVISSRIKTME